MTVVVHYLWQMQRVFLRQWGAGSVFLLLVTFVQGMLLHPAVQLGVRQRMGFFLLLLLFATQLVVWERLSPAYVRWLVEACSVSVHARWLWLWDLIGFWCVSAVVILGMMPLFCFMYHFDAMSSFWAYLLWCCMSPLLLVQLYLLRLVGLLMKSGMALVWVVLVPWVLPSLLMAAQLFEIFLRQGVFLSSLAFFIGMQMLMLAFFAHVLSVLIVKCYHHLCLH